MMRPWGTQKRWVLWSLMLSLSVSWPEKASGTDIPLDDLRSILQYNENTLLSYQGRVTQQEYRMVETNNEGKYVKPLERPLLVRTTETEFVHDVTRGEDYLVTMRHHSDLFGMELPVTTERRNGDYLETLGQTDAREPRLGIISPLKDSYYLGHSPRNFDAATHLYILTSATEQGFYRLPLSQAMADSEYVWPCGTEAVEGYTCRKYAVQIEAPSGKEAFMAYVWLGQDVNFNIIKQETIMMPVEALKPFSEVAGYGDVTQQLEKYQWSGKPAMLIVNKNYVNTESGVWVPEIATSYVLGSLNPSKLLNPDDRSALTAANSLDPHTQGLLDCVVTGFHVWTLDMNSLVLNEPIDPNVFERSIIPEGIPVSNFRLGIHPRDLARIAQQNLETAAPHVPDSNVPSGPSRGAENGDRPSPSLPVSTTPADSPSDVPESNAVPGQVAGERSLQAEARSTSGAHHGSMWWPAMLGAFTLLAAGMWLAHRTSRDRAQG